MSIPITVIQTHGSYMNFTDDTFKTPINVNIIRAVPLGSCNYLNEEIANDIDNRIIKFMNNSINKKQDIDLNKIAKLLKNADTVSLDAIETLQDTSISLDSDSDEKKYQQLSAHHYKIHKYSKSQLLSDKHFIILPIESNASDSGYNKIILYQILDNKINKLDMTRHIKGPFRRSGSTILLSELLKHLKNMDIDNVLLIDLSCSGSIEGRAPPPSYGLGIIGKSKNRQSKNRQSKNRQSKNRQSKNRQNKNRQSKNRQNKNRQSKNRQSKKK